MTTNYDPIAEQYKRSKQQPWRTHIEAFSLLNLIGPPTGLNVLDMACGEGFYTRMVRQKGAAKVTGVDLSEGMIDLARKQEVQHRLGIDYIVGDARDLDLHEKCDLVMAAYLLNYAADRAALQAMCNGIARCLKPGGRFVTVNGSASLHFPSAPSYRKYGFETKVVADWQEGAPIIWKFFLEDGTFEIENYYLDRAIHEEAFRAAGFRDVHWHEPQLSSAGEAEFDSAFWADFMDHSPIMLIDCRK
ncbi:MAG TPA: class I SAM-dependent methyltransferase [Planctomycetaceae bacterium]|jgi:ubiquinone/menaquinone biosynthesis C-methylase UbiE|nr:class I SAM-dependent methyltransferase [Planctomycetaceae bacterium]